MIIPWNPVAPATGAITGPAGRTVLSATNSSRSMKCRRALVVDSAAAQEVGFYPMVERTLQA